MTVYFSKSLDRPIDIFGIKGKWLTIFLIAAGISIVFALIAGFMISAGVGIAVAIIFIVASFFGCMILQGKIPQRQVMKARASSKIYPYVSRRETVGRILLPDPRANNNIKTNGR